VTNYANHLKEWTGRLMSMGSTPKKNKRVRTRVFEPTSGEGHDHRSGAEDNACHVNGEPEQPNDKNDRRRHGAEGNAFQVNGDSSETGENTGENP
jgi:hypothetical protein